jgi:hypothetical protein
MNPKTLFCLFVSISLTVTSVYAQTIIKKDEFTVTQDFSSDTGLDITDGGIVENGMLTLDGNELPVEDNMIWYFPFNQSKTDLTGRGYLNYYGDANSNSYDFGINDYALSLSTLGYVANTSSTIFNDGSPTTIELWCYIEDHAVSDTRLVYQIDIFNTSLSSGQNLTFTIESSSVSSTISYDQWNHVVITYDQITDDVDLYINGNHIGHSDTSFSVNPDRGEFNIGRNIQCKIDDFIVRNVVLDHNTIKEHSRKYLASGLCTQKLLDSTAEVDVFDSISVNVSGITTDQDYTGDTQKAMIWFSQNGSDFYDNLGNAATETNGCVLYNGANNISLSALNWSGDEFFYKVKLTSILGAPDTCPTIDSLSFRYANYYSTYYVSSTTGSDTTGDGSQANPWATIGCAISAIGSLGETITICVQSGTYNEYISIPAGITLKGGYDSSWNYDPDNNVTTLTTTTANSIVTMTHNSKIYGFKITGGDAAGNGGAIKIYPVSEEGDITIEDCLITENTATYSGGGIFIKNCTADVQITNCVINQNTAEQMWGGGINLDRAETAYNGKVFIYDSVISNNLAVTGGGLRTYQQEIEIINCEFSGNLAKRGDTINNYAQGGGIASVYADFTIKNCVFKNNECEGNGVDSSSSDKFISGAGINIVRGEGTIENCIVENNICKSTNNAKLMGCGIYLGNVVNGCAISNCEVKDNILDTPYTAYGSAIWSHDSDVQIYNSTIFNNTITNATTTAGVTIYISDANYTFQNAIINSTIYNNKASTATSSIRNTTSTPVLITNSILWNNDDEINGAVTLSYSCVEDTEDTGSGVTHSDPLFMNAENGDLHISLNSPCVNTGNNNAINPTTYPLDMDGENRLVNTTIDMGADEYLDTDVDGLADYYEINQYYTDVLSADTDGDGITDYADTALGLNPHVAQIHDTIPSEFPTIALTSCNLVGAGYLSVSGTASNTRPVVLDFGVLNGDENKVVNQSTVFSFLLERDICNISVANVLSCTVTDLDTESTDSASLTIAVPVESFDIVAPQDGAVISIKDSATQ